MPNFNYIQVQPNSLGLKLDTSELINGSNTVERQNICITDPTSAVNIANVSAKGNQGTYSLVTQPLKDTGRTAICFSFYSYSVTGETLIAFNYIFKNGSAAVSGATSYTVTVGKTLRIQCINMFATGNAGNWASVNLRSGPSVLTVANSFILLPLHFVPQTAWLGVCPAVFPDGLEIPGGTTIGISLVALSGLLNIWASMIGYEY